MCHLSCVMQLSLRSSRACAPRLLAHPARLPEAASFSSLMSLGSHVRRRHLSPCPTPWQRGKAGRCPSLHFPPAVSFQAFSLDKWA